MAVRAFLTRFESNALTRGVLFVVGALLVLVSPIVGAIPGPGGIFVFAAGLTLMLRASRTIKKLYARLARRWPGHVGYLNWGLRRRSHKRRVERSTRRSSQE